MKKYFVFMLALLAASLIVYAGDTDFTSAFKNCSSFTDSGNVKTEGMDVQSVKQITGKDGDKCVYKETVNVSGQNITITCKFTDTQRYELVSVMEAYDLVQKYSAEDIDTSNLSSVQNNPVVKAWTKYLQDSSVCTMDGLK